MGRAEGSLGIGALVVGLVRRLQQVRGPASEVLVVLVDGALDLLGVDLLVVLIEQLDLVLPQKQHDLVLDVLLSQRVQDLFALGLTKLFLQPVCYLAPDLLHDLHVRSLCHLSADLDGLSVVVELADLGLGNGLVEHLLVEALGVPVDEVVIELSSVGLDHE